MADGKAARHVVPAELVADRRQFTVPYAVNLTLTRTDTSKDLYKVEDTNGDVVLNVKGVSSFSSRLLLLHAAGTPLLTMKPKALSLHDTWSVFRGESTSPNDLLFSVRRTKVFQWKDKFDVFLTTNTDEAAPCDFKIIARSEKYCTICIGETDEIIAQMHRKDKLEITVNPNEDFAFIVSLTVILEEIEKSSQDAASAISSASEAIASASEAIASAIVSGASEAIASAALASFTC